MEVFKTVLDAILMVFALYNILMALRCRLDGRQIDGLEHTAAAILMIVVSQPM